MNKNFYVIILSALVISLTISILSNPIVSKVLSSWNDTPIEQILSRSMTPGARTLYGNKCKVINKIVKETEAAKTKKNTELELQLRNELSKKYKELAQIVEINRAGMIANNPDQSFIVKYAPDLYRKTAEHMIDLDSYTPSYLERCY
jgi:DNA-binding XRE family transcriptional regulator